MRVDPTGPIPYPAYTDASKPNLLHLDDAGQLEGANGGMKKVR